MMHLAQRRIVHAAVEAAQAALARAEGPAASEAELQCGTDAALANAIRDAHRAIEAAVAVIR